MVTQDATDSLLPGLGVCGCCGCGCSCRCSMRPSSGDGRDWAQCGPMPCEKKKRKKYDGENAIKSVIAVVGLWLLLLLTSPDLSSTRPIYWKAAGRKNATPLEVQTRLSWNRLPAPLFEVHPLETGSGILPPGISLSHLTHAARQRYRARS